jgi:hypothetical protein
MAVEGKSEKRDGKGNYSPQDQALQNKYYSTKILQTERANAECKQFEETVGRIIWACLIWGKEIYIQRHDTVCVELHSNICDDLGGKLYNKHLCAHIP